MIVEKELANELDTVLRSYLNTENTPWTMVAIKQAALSVICKYCNINPHIILGDNLGRYFYIIDFLGFDVDYDTNNVRLIPKFREGSEVNG